MVALTNEHAGSDGDIFSHTFKLMKLGPLVGTRTWGGVVGIWPRHALVDGTETTQPEFSFWFNDVGWGVENYGTDPDDRGRQRAAGLRRRPRPAARDGAGDGARASSGRRRRRCGATDRGRACCGRRCRRGSAAEPARNAAARRPAAFLAASRAANAAARSFAALPFISAIAAFFIASSLGRLNGFGLLAAIWNFFQSTAL